MDWFRWWHGACNDPKLRMIASECSIPLASVIGLWIYLLDSASSNQKRGQIDNFDAEIAAFHLGIDVVTPCNAMKRRKMFHETDGTLYVTNWEKWQPKREREDNSTDRVRLHREKQKQALSITENHVTPCNANETPVTPREEKIRVDKEQERPTSFSADAPKENAPVSKKITFKTWIEKIKASGEKPISEYEPVWRYVKNLGIPDDWVLIAWIQFTNRYSTDPTYSGKRYSDWRRHFLNAIEGNWFSLWRIDNEGKFALTTVGIQADMATKEMA